jgi:hypothetical protein
MSIPNKLLALFEALTLAQLERLRPEELRRFADACRRWADIANGCKLDKGNLICAEARQATAKAAFLSELRDGRGRE